MAQRISPSSVELPTRIPLFPLRDVLLLPGGDLPLNMFEPRYLAMTQMALQGQRLVGMIQPKNDQGELYRMGCAGRIVTFNETDDGRYLITLRGVRRFILKRYQLTADNFYLADIEWIAEDNAITDGSFTPPTICRNKLKSLVDHILARENMTIDWHEALHMPEGKFYTLLAMLAPLSVTEKQALLEACDLNTRCDILIRLLEMTVADPTAETDDKTACLQ